MKRFHSHKSGTAWKPEQVRYFFHIKGRNALWSSKGEWLISYGGKSHTPPEKSCCSVGFLTMHPCFIEVQEADLPYLKKPEGEWEFRKPKAGDTTMSFWVDTIEHGRPIEWGNNPCAKDQGSRFGGYRWCKPKKAQHRCAECGQPLPTEMFENI